MSHKNTIIIDQDYLISRINQWHIKLRENKIYGQMKMFGFDDEINVSGRIIGFVGNRVFARIENNNRLYALVLGQINEEQKDRRGLFIRYLKRMIPGVQTES